MKTISALVGKKSKAIRPLRRPAVTDHVYDQISPNLLPLVSQRYV